VPVPRGPMRAAWRAATLITVPIRRRSLAKTSQVLQRKYRTPICVNSPDRPLFAQLGPDRRAGQRV